MQLRFLLIFFLNVSFFVGKAENTSQVDTSSSVQIKIKLENILQHRNAIVTSSVDAYYNNSGVILRFESNVEEVEIVIISSGCVFYRNQFPDVSGEKVIETDNYPVGIYDLYLRVGNSIWKGTFEIFASN